jgi:hypothetical protein
VIKHIVMWSFAEHAAGAHRAANLQIAMDKLAALAGLVPGMEKLEVVIPSEPFEHSYDLVLYSEFDSPESLAAYASHPEHVEVGRFISQVRTDRICVDYQL